MGAIHLDQRAHDKGVGEHPLRGGCGLDRERIALTEIDHEHGGVARADAAAQGAAHFDVLLADEGGNVRVGRGGADAVFLSGGQVVGERLRGRNSQAADHEGGQKDGC